MLTVEFKFTPAGKFAGDPYVQLRIVDVSDNGDETHIAKDSGYLCDDDHSEDAETRCEFSTPQGLTDYILSDLGFERTSPYTFDDLEGFEQSADIRRVE